MNTEEKLKLLYEAIGRPQCKFFKGHGSPCAQSDRFAYVNHLTYSCDGSILDCDWDEEKAKKMDEEERAYARRETM